MFRKGWLSTFWHRPYPFGNDHSTNWTTSTARCYLVIDRLYLLRCDDVGYCGCVSVKSCGSSDAYQHVLSLKPYDVTVMMDTYMCCHCNLLLFYTHWYLYIGLTWLSYLLFNRVHRNKSYVGHVIDGVPTTSV